jgi:hypothetical protein
MLSLFIAQLTDSSKLVMTKIAENKIIKKSFFSMSKLSFGAYAFEKVRCTTIQIRGNEEKNSVKLIYHFKVYLENVTKFCTYSSLAGMITLKV